MYTFYNLLHFLLIVLPLIFSLQLYTYKRKHILSNNILGTLMLVVSAYYFINARFFSQQLNITEINSFFTYLLLLSVTPFYYLYTKSLTNEKFKIKYTCLLHYLPAFIVFITNIIIKTNHSVNTPEYIANLRISVVIIYNIQILVYTITMFYLLHKHNINLNNYFSFKNEENNLNWLRVFLVIFILFSGLDLMVFYIQSFASWELFYYILTILFFTFLGYYGNKQTDIYAVARANVDSTITDNEIGEDDHNSIEKRQVITNEISDKLLKDLINLMETKKIYNNPELSIFDVADMLKINKTYISYTINKNLKENFSSFINKFRIEEAKYLLKSPDYNKYTIEGIAKLVGFNSKSSFNTAFKKYTKTTPSLFKKQSE